MESFCFKRIFLSIWFVWTFFGSLSANEVVYLTTKDELTLFEFNAKTHALNKAKSYSIAGAGIIEVNVQANASYLYLNTKSKKKKSIITFKIKKDGLLERVFEAPIDLRTCYLSIDKQAYVLTGTDYGQGQTHCWLLEEGIYKGKIGKKIELEKKAHCNVFSPDNRWILVPATGPNKIFSIPYNKKVLSTAKSHVITTRGPQVKGGPMQPRHIKFHSNEKWAYTSLEREEPGIGFWKWDTEKGQLELMQTVPSKPQGFDGFMTTAELHLTPDEKFLYLSNRDNSKRNSTTGKDGIVGFKILKDGRLEKIGHTPCEHIPRAFDISHDGKTMLVAGQGDGHLGTYSIQSDGALKKLSSMKVGDKPLWVEFVRLK